MRFPSHILLDLKKPTASYSKSWLSYYWSTASHDAMVKPVDDETVPVFANAVLLEKDTRICDFSTRFRFPIKEGKKTKTKIRKFCTTKFTVKYTRTLNVKTWRSVMHKTRCWTFLHLTRHVRCSNYMWSLFDINFIRKEFLYAKLKYSRSPQHDIVSGGVAALFAGFIGFLISEKFGIELVDSADFYTGFMYIVFLAFAIKSFFKGFGAVVPKEIYKEVNGEVIPSLKYIRQRTFLNYTPKTFYLDFYNYLSTIFNLQTKFMLAQAQFLIKEGPYSLKEVATTTFKTEYWSVVYRRFRLIKRLVLNYGRLNFDFNHLD